MHISQPNLILLANNWSCLCSCLSWKYSLLHYDNVSHLEVHRTEDISTSYQCFDENAWSIGENLFWRYKYSSCLRSEAEEFYSYSNLTHDQNAWVSRANTERTNGSRKSLYLELLIWCCVAFDLQRFILVVF